MQVSNENGSGVESSVLFQPARMGQLELRNRFVRSATAELLCDESGNVSEAFVRAYRRLGKGGVGLIIKGHQV